MQFDYIIIGGGCAGLSLAYELDLHKKLENKTLAIIEPRDEYRKDKTWSFWKVINHNFDDCVKKSWKNFSINSLTGTKHLQCDNYPYQSIDSGLFYKKTINKLKESGDIEKTKVLAKELINLSNSLGLLEQDPEIFLKSGVEMNESEVQAPIDEREKSRDEGDYSKADEIRDQLLEKNIILEDSKEGTFWRRR